MLDLHNATREELIQLNLQLIAQLQVLQERVKQLEAELESLRGGGSKTNSPTFVKANRPARSKKKKPKKRAHGFARRLDFVTFRLDHCLQQCSECRVDLTGRRVVKSRRLIELPRLEAQDVEHNLVERGCPQCRKRFRPDLDLSWFAVGKKRLGISVQAEVALLREACRLPFRDIQDYLRHRFSLRVSVGELVELVKAVAHAGKAIYERAKQYKGPNARLSAIQQQQQRVKRQRELEQELMRVSRPHLKKKRVQSKLCERIERIITEMFVFVADERVP